MFASIDEPFCIKKHTLANNLIWDDMWGPFTRFCSMLVACLIVLGTKFGTVCCNRFHPFKTKFNPSIWICQSPWVRRSRPVHTTIDFRVPFGMFLNLFQKQRNLDLCRKINGFGMLYSGIVFRGSWCRSCFHWLILVSFSIFWISPNARCGPYFCIQVQQIR